MTTVGSHKDLCCSLQRHYATPPEHPRIGDASTEAWAVLRMPLHPGIHVHIVRSPAGQCFFE